MNSHSFCCQEFTSIVCGYCIFNKEDILRFAFDCFDLDGSGKIDTDEVTELISMLNDQDPKFSANIRAAEEAIRSDQGTAVPAIYLE